MENPICAEIISLINSVCMRDHLPAEPPQIRTDGYLDIIAGAPVSLGRKRELLTALDPRQKDLREYGVLKLCGDWAFTPRGSGKAAAPEQIDGMKEYKVLFAAGWEGAVSHDAVSDYFAGLSYWDKMLRDAVFYRQIARGLPCIQDVQTLEAYVREHNLFSMNDQGA